MMMILVLSKSVMANTVATTGNWPKAKRAELRKTHARIKCARSIVAQTNSKEAISAKAIPQLIDATTKFVTQHAIVCGT